MNAVSILECGKRKAKPPTVEMIAMTPTTSTELQTRIQKAIKDKGITPRAYEKYLLRKYGKTSTSIL